jgi:spore germination protein (amino acid permease)
MEKRQITTRQMLILLFAGTLSPTIRALPRRSAAIGGTGGWLSAVVAIVPVLLVAWAILACLRRMPKGSGLGELMERGVGKGAARVLSGVYAGWMLLSVAAFLRIYSERFLSTTYANSSIYLFLISILLLTLWNSNGSFGAFARMGQIFFVILVITLALVLGLTASQVKAENILPLWWEDTPDILKSSIPAMGTLAYGVYLFFLGGQTKDLTENRRMVLRWTFSFGVLLTVMQVITMGVFGAPMVARMQVPFFMLTKEINLYGAMERMESMIVALWVITDVVLVGLMVRAICAALEFAFQLSDGQKLATPLVLGLLPAAVLIAASQFALEEFCTKVLNTGNLLLAYLVPSVVCVLAAVRNRKTEKSS